MATINELGNISARCPGCNGGISTYEWRAGGGEFGSIEKRVQPPGGGARKWSYRLFKCAGCGRGGIGLVVFGSGADSYPGSYRELKWFYREVEESLTVPASVPVGIRREFREAEDCLSNRCYRAAAGLFRSVLEKTLRANGYRPNRESLYDQIEAAAADGVITEARRRRAQDEVRVLGNDVLHDDWHEIDVEDVRAARHYCQRVLEDFYDDRESVERQLTEKGRLAQAEPQAGGPTNVEGEESASA